MTSIYHFYTPEQWQETTNKLQDISNIFGSDIIRYRRWKEFKDKFVTKKKDAIIKLNALFFKYSIRYQPSENLYLTKSSDIDIIINRLLTDLNNLGTKTKQQLSQIPSLSDPMNQLPTLQKTEQEYLKLIFSSLIRLKELNEKVSTIDEQFDKLNTSYNEHSNLAKFQSIKNNIELMNCVDPELLPAKKATIEALELIIKITNFIITQNEITLQIEKEKDCLKKNNFLPDIEEIQKEVIAALENKKYLDLANIMNGLRPLKNEFQVLCEKYYINYNYIEVLLQYELISLKSHFDSIKAGSDQESKKTELSSIILVDLATVKPHNTIDALLALSDLNNEKIIFYLNNTVNFAEFYDVLVTEDRRFTKYQAEKIEIEHKVSAEINGITYNSTKLWLGHKVFKLPVPNAIVEKATIEIINNNLFGQLGQLVWNLFDRNSCNDFQDRTLSFMNNEMKLFLKSWHNELFNNSITQDIAQNIARDVTRYCLSYNSADKKFEVKNLHSGAIGRIESSVCKIVNIVHDWKSYINEADYPGLDINECEPRWDINSWGVLDEPA